MQFDFQETLYILHVIVSHMSPGHQVLKVHQLKGTVLIGVNFVGYSEKKSPEVRNKNH